MLVSTFLLIMTLIVLGHNALSPLNYAAWREQSPGRLLRFWFPLGSTHPVDLPSEQRENSIAEGLVVDSVFLVGHCALR